MPFGIGRARRVPPSRASGDAGPCNKWHPGPRVLFIPNKSPVRKHPAATVFSAFTHAWTLGERPRKRKSEIKQIMRYPPPSPSSSMPTQLPLAQGSAIHLRARFRVRPWSLNFDYQSIVSIVPDSNSASGCFVHKCRRCFGKYRVITDLRRASTRVPSG